MKDKTWNDNNGIIMFLFLLLTSVKATTFFFETFENDSNWIESSTRHDGDKMGSFQLTENYQLKTDEDARFYTMFAPLATPVDQTEYDFVLEYSIQLNNTDFKCGGAYLKLFEFDGDIETINHETPYKLMFGPDFSCNGQSKVHAILTETQWSVVENADILKDGKEHVFTFMIRSDNTYSYYVDKKERQTGDIEDAWELLEPRQIDNPSISKPDDWPSPSMLDPEHVKPNGYDDIMPTIVDFDAVKPSDWDEEEDEQWEPPQLPNPEYHGPWSQRSVPNPEYSGPWVHPQLPNPKYIPNATLYNQFSGANVIGFELWNFDSGLLFDNILISDRLTFSDEL